MTDPQPSAMPKAKSTSRLMLQTMIGAVVGAATTGLLLGLIDERELLLGDPQRLIALVAGLMFALMAVFVGLGAAAPAAGGKLLNVEDASEVRERRSELGIGAVLVGLAGTILLVLSLTSVEGSVGLLPASVSIVIVGLCFAALAIIGFLSRNSGDEFEKLMSVESGALAFNISVIFFGGWAILAYLGHTAWIGPLALFAGLMITYFMAIIWVVGRRGLLSR